MRFTTIGLFGLLAVFSMTQNTLGLALVYPRDVINPTILEPKQGESYNKGDTLTVLWDNSPVPPGAPRGEIILGFTDPSNPDSGENLDLDHPLAKNVDLTTGRYDVKLDLDSIDKTRGTYIVVLLGNSGNSSPPFKITVY